MPALAVFFLMLGVIVTFMSPPEDKNDIRAKVESTNYLVYRNAVNEYAVTHPGFSGTIPDADLDLIEEWKNLGGWLNRVESEIVYVYGSMTPGAVYYVAKKSNSAAVGVKRDGTLQHPIWGDTGQSVPAFVPDGDVVSMIKDN